MYFASCCPRYASTLARRTPLSGIAPMTGSVSAGPGPTLKTCVNWLSPPTSSRIWSPSAKSLCGIAVGPASGQVSSSSASRRTTIRSIMALLHRYALCQVARPIHVAATQHGDVIRQELERNDRQHQCDRGWARRHGDLVIRQMGQIAVALARDRDNAAPPGFYFLHIRNHLRVNRILGRQADDRHVLVDQGDRSVLHLGRRVALSMDVGDLLELERALERDREIGAPAQIEGVAGVRIAFGEHPHLRLDRERALHQLREPDQLRDQPTPLLRLQTPLAPEVQPEQ